MDLYSPVTALAGIGPSRAKQLQGLGIETLFIVSAILGLCHSAYAATIKSRKQLNA